MELVDKKALTFDDVLLMPQYTEIKSRQDVILKTHFTSNHIIDIPIISANMDTITEWSMMRAMFKSGGVGILHRFLNIETMIKQIKLFIDNASPSLLAFSVGINGDAEERINAIKENFPDIHICVCIDVAHGDCKRVLETCKFINTHYDCDIIAGNVATPEAIKRLCDIGVDAIKVGIGPGSMCTTRIVTGCGVPQLTAIIECVQEANKFNVPIIADGGIRNSGDIVKALAAGASSVMIGSLFAGTDESTGEFMIDNSSPLPEYHKKYKKYRGMASRDAMTGWKGNYHAAPEGESKYVECKGPVSNILNDLLGGIRSGMTYCNAKDLIMLRDNAKFRIVSSNTLLENRAHGK